MNANEIKQLKQKLISIQNKRTEAIELTKEEANYLSAMEDNSMSMEDALTSHGFEIHLKDQLNKQPNNINTRIIIEDAEKLAAKGDFLEPPASIFMSNIND